MSSTITAATPGLSRGRPLSPWLIVGLAALAVPRVIAHDLQLASSGSVANQLLAFVPPLIWLAVVLWQRPPRPLLTHLLIGACYGVMLAIGHQIMWTAAYDGNPPQLGGNLAGRLDPAVENIVMRSFAFVSSVITGTLVGAVVGAIGMVLARLLPSPARS
jgi:hypothetical protein